MHIQKYLEVQYIELTGIINVNQKYLPIQQNIRFMMNSALALQKPNFNLGQIIVRVCPESIF